MSRALRAVFLLAVALWLVCACNADPKKIGRKATVKPKKDYLSDFVAAFKVQRTPLFVRPDVKNVHVVLSPADIPLFSPKRQEVGVLVLQFEPALDAMRTLELSTPRAPVDCPVDWHLYVFEKGPPLRVEIQWECKAVRMRGQTLELRPEAVKRVGDLITSARLHPTHKATVLQVPVVHEPETVTGIVSQFVQDVLPLDYRRMRYPSFTVTTEHIEALGRDVSQVDDQVARLRERLVGRLNDFANAIRKKGGATIVDILPPFPVYERFSQELHARWGMTVLCALGTGSDRMYWLASSPRFGIVGMELPTHYPLLVVQLPPTDPRPDLSAQIDGLSLDPPLVWPK